MTSSSTTEFVDQLSRSIREIDALRVDHIQAFGELLPHVLFGELTQWAQEEAKRDDESHALRSFLTMVESEWAQASPDVENLITVSFLENIDDHAHLLRLLSPELRQLAYEMGVQP